MRALETCRTSHRLGVAAVGQGASGAVWGREVWLQPLRGPGAVKRPRGPCGGSARLLPSCPGRAAPSSRTPVCGGVSGLASAPLSQPGGTQGFLECKENNNSQLHRFFVSGRAARGLRVPGLDQGSGPLLCRCYPRCAAGAAPLLHRVSAPHQGGARAPAFRPPAPTLGTCRPDF